jgi:hypothetical protein
VTPRLVPIVALGACVLLLAAARERNASTGAPVVATTLLMLAAALADFGLPPTDLPSDTTAGEMYVGEPFSSSGAPTQDRRAIVRYAIECCRADAQPVVLRLDRRLPQAGAWFSVRGHIARDVHGYFLAVAECDERVLPTDPYFYR